MTKIFLRLVCLLMFFSIGVFSQMRERKTIAPKRSAKNCRIFLNGKLLNNPQPVYPIEAKVAGIAGKVEVAIEIDRNGSVMTIENFNGDQ